MSDKVRSTVRERSTISIITMASHRVWNPWWVHAIAQPMGAYRSLCRLLLETFLTFSSMDRQVLERRWTYFYYHFLRLYWENADKDHVHSSRTIWTWCREGACPQCCLLHSLTLICVLQLRIDQRVFVTPSNRKLDVNVVQSNYHIELTPSDVGMYDRVVIQDILKEIAQTQQVDLNAKQRFKGQSLSWWINSHRSWPQSQWSSLTRRMLLLETPKQHYDEPWKSIWPIWDLSSAPIAQAKSSLLLEVDVCLCEWLPLQMTK